MPNRGFDIPGGQDECRDSDRTCLLGWNDTIDRLDILLLEIRHLQSSIIHSLREPVFYQVLEDEQEHLWADSWLGKGGADEDAFLRDDPHFLVRNWIRLFPTPSSVRRPNGERDRFDDLDKEVLDSFLHGWFHGEWGQGQRRNYHTLHSTQRLKRVILADKVLLCQEALKQKVHVPFSGMNERVRRERLPHARFMVLRAAILRRIKDHAKRLRDFQAALSKTMDSGQQDHPRPSIERRREVGIYMDHLSNRARDIALNMKELMAFLDGEGRFRKNPNPVDEDSLTLHRWSHDTVSRTSRFDDEVARKLDQRGSVIDFINTSYFMPERPDLQPVIAHEVAHGVIRSHLAGLDDFSLKALPSPFADLALQIKLAIIAAKEKYGITESDSGVYSAVSVEEILADLFAASVKGLSYLHAFFLETVALDQADLMLRSDGRIDLGRFRDLDRLGHVHAGERLWYLRLRIIIKWISLTHHRDLCDLDQSLLNGTATLLEEINLLLNRIIDPQHREEGLFWAVLAERIEQLMKESDAADLVRVWRGMRSKDGEGNAPLLFSKAAAPLPVALRQKLFDVQVSRKVGPRRVMGLCELKRRRAGNPDAKTYPGAGQVLGEVRRDNPHEFCRVHISSQSASGDLPDSLFRHVFDIPWQCAYMRAFDFLALSGDARKSLVTEMNDDPDAGLGFDSLSERVLWELHYDFANGRHLFEISVEFYNWFTDTAVPRLRIARKLVNEVQDPNFWPHTDSSELKRMVCESLTGWASEGSDKSWDQREIDVFLEDLFQGRDRLFNTLRKAGDQFDGSDRFNDRLDHDRDAYLSVISERSSGVSADLILDQIADCKDGVNSWVMKTDSDAAAILGHGGINRLAALMAGFKIEELRRRLCDLRQDLGDQFPQSLIPLLSYVTIRSDRPVDDVNGVSHSQAFYQSVLDSVVANGPNGPMIPAYLLGRLSLAGCYRGKEWELGGRSSEQRETGPGLAHALVSEPHCYINELAQAKVLRTNKPVADSKFQKIYQLTTLGRYDGMLISEVHHICRCALPKARSVENGRQGHQSFFIRRESAHPVRLRDGNVADLLRAWEWSSDDLSGDAAEDKATMGGKTRVLGFLAVVLERRAYRLDLVHRIRHAISSIDKEDGEDAFEAGLQAAAANDDALDGLGALFAPNDIAFLTDGWADVLLVFTVDSDEQGKFNNRDVLNRLRAVTRIQDAVFQDFMVDRTELIWTPHAYNALVIGHQSDNENERKFVSNQFDVRVHTRLLEDRKLEPSLVRYRDNIFNGSGPGSGQEDVYLSMEGAGVKGARISHTVGRVDFTVGLDFADKTEFTMNLSDNPYASMVSWLCTGYVDRFDTAINRLEPGELTFQRMPAEDAQRS